MMRSLRARLTVAMVAVTVAAATIVAVGTGAFTNREVRRIFDIEHEFRLDADPPIEALATALADPANRDEAERLLRETATGERAMRWVVVDPAGSVRADTDPDDDERIVRHPDGSIELVRDVAGPDGGIAERRVRVGGGIAIPGLDPPGGSDRSKTAVFVLPLDVDPSPGERGGRDVVVFDGGPDRARATPATIAPGTRTTTDGTIVDGAEVARRIRAVHVAGVLVAALFAAAVAHVVARRIVRPLEALTSAAGRMERGERSARVEVVRQDEVGELANAFNRMAAALDRQEGLRRGMANDVAHELRTPLTHLRARLEAVEDGVVPLDRELVTTLHGEIVHLARLVDDLQELSLAEAGRLAFDPLRFDVVELARDVARSIDTSAGGGIEVRAAGTIPDGFADPDRVRQVLRNLLHNGLRHGGADVVDVVVTHDAGGPGEADDADGGRGATAEGGSISVSVIDRGPGIPAEHLPHVFERFYRTDPARARETGGAGLGLAIARQLVGGWGGTIEVTSASGAGATFRFTIPTA